MSLHRRITVIASHSFETRYSISRCLEHTCTNQWRIQGEVVLKRHYTLTSVFFEFHAKICQTIDWHSPLGNPRSTTANVSILILVLHVNIGKRVGFLVDVHLVKWIFELRAKQQEDIRLGQYWFLLLCLLSRSESRDHFDTQCRRCESESLSQPSSICLTVTTIHDLFIYWVVKSVRPLRCHCYKMSRHPPCVNDICR